MDVREARKEYKPLNVEVGDIVRIKYDSSGSVYHMIVMDLGVYGGYSLRSLDGRSHLGGVVDTIGDINQLLIQHIEDSIDNRVRILSKHEYEIEFVKKGE